jgi:hypothetical protein
MAGYIQIVEFQTSRIDEVKALGEDYAAKREANGSGPLPIASTLTADRKRPGTYMHVVRFNSYEEAMENSGRADTNEFAQSMMAVCDGPPTFYDLDVLDTWQPSAG